MSSHGPNRKLTQPEFYKLCQYLETRREDLTSNSYLKTSLASQCGKKLGFDIAVNTLNTALDSTGIQMKVAANPTSGSGSVWAALRTLARSHVQLCRDLGNNCPPEIELLAQE